MPPRKAPTPPTDHIRKTAYLYARFSTAGQTDGDSLRRQTDLGRRWCEANGYTLDESYRDEGTSGFKGKHRKEGALSRFLEAVRAGTIPAGAVLLVENIDRLSRESSWDFLGLLLELVNAGVRVVQLDTGEVLDRGTSTFALMQTLLSQFRGHDESARKSRMIGASWEQWRQSGKSRGKPTKPGPVPFWLDRQDDGYALNAHAAVVREVFRLAGDGWGTLRIQRELRRREVKVITKNTSDGILSTPYLGAILTNPVAYGRDEDLDRDDYYPAVVSREEFFRVQAVKKTLRKGTARDRSQVRLLAKVIEDFETGRPYIARRWPTGGKNAWVYYPYDVRRNLTETKSFPVAALERAVLKSVKELDPVAAFGTAETPTRLPALEGERADVATRLAELEEAMVEGAGAAAAVRAAARLEARLAELDKAIGEERVRTAAPPASQSLTEAQRLIVADPDQLTDEQRLRLRVALGRVVNKVRVAFNSRGVFRMCFAAIELEGGYFRELTVLWHRSLAGKIPEFFWSDDMKLVPHAERSTPAEAWGLLGDVADDIERQRKEARREFRREYYRQYDAKKKEEMTAKGFKDVKSWRKAKKE